MLAVEICEQMGWDYHTYREQPQEFIDAIEAKIVAKSRYNNYIDKKNGN